MPHKIVLANEYSGTRLKQVCKRCTYFSQTTPIFPLRFPPILILSRFRSLRASFFSASFYPWPLWLKGPMGSRPRLESFVGQRSLFNRTKESGDESPETVLRKRYRTETQGEGRVERRIVSSTLVHFSREGSREGVGNASGTACLADKAKGKPEQRRERQSCPSSEWL